MKARTTKVRIRVEESSGNVFEDLGVPNHEEALVKAKLALHIAELVEAKGLKQDEAAKRMGIDQPKVSRILRGQFREFSIERLLGFLRAIGCSVDIVLRNGTRIPASFRVVAEKPA